jgi:hypothetical protein
VEKRVGKYLLKDSDSITRTGDIKNGQSFIEVFQSSLPGKAAATPAMTAGKGLNGGMVLS